MATIIHEKSATCMAQFFLSLVLRIQSNHSTHFPNIPFRMWYLGSNGYRLDTVYLQQSVTLVDVTGQHGTISAASV